MKLLDTINSPSDLKKLSVDMLPSLSEEIREALIYKLSKSGGHCASNLGIVELTIALHYVFDSPTDKLIFDVSHQCYTHKIITGRKQAFIDSEHFNDVTGYTNPRESEHDLFSIGHASTSISLAMGLALARDKRKEKTNVIAIIGDGSLSGGEAMEALNIAGDYNGNLIIVLNDNEQSIAENHGGLYKALAELRATEGKSDSNIFKAVGLDYVYIEDGHDIGTIINILNNIKDTEHPTVVHVHTIKGKGYERAEEDKERFHEVVPFDTETGRPTLKNEQGMDITVFKNLKRILDSDEKAILFNAATPFGFGFSASYRNKYRDLGQFVDVGIEEENVVTIAAGAQRGGVHAIVALFAPFFQRAYDQVSHDVALNDIPLTMLVMNPGVYGYNSNTHLGLCDIQLFSHIPNLIYLSPSSREEFRGMLEYAVKQNDHPVAIRTMLNFPVSKEKDNTDYAVLKNKKVRSGSGVAIFAVGCLVKLAIEVADKVEELHGRRITVINPCFINSIDAEQCNALLEDHNTIITIEDGEVFGGYGYMISQYYCNYDMKVINHGISKHFYTGFSADKILDDHGISLEKLIHEVEMYI